jgi:hypothetical protein
MTTRIIEKSNQLIWEQSAGLVQSGAVAVQISLEVAFARLMDRGYACTSIELDKDGGRSFVISSTYNEFGLWLGGENGHGICTDCGLPYYTNLDGTRMRHMSYCTHPTETQVLVWPSGGLFWRQISGGEVVASGFYPSTFGDAASNASDRQALITFREKLIEMGVNCTLISSFSAELPSETEGFFAEADLSKPEQFPGKLLS